MFDNIVKTIRIARIELNSMFYSPVAWIVLIIFAFQVGMSFAGTLDGYLNTKAMGYSLYQVTSGLFTDMTGLFAVMTKNLYLYIPLITMGLMSREYQSGSIKLLYSSPIKNSSIVMGKFMSMVIYGAALMSIITFYVIFSYFAVENFDLPMVLTGMLGIFLLLLAYSAIGLFMSTITSYQVVAAIGTLALLAALNYVGGVGQNIDFVRDITYWLSISGRSYSFINGMISSEDLIYFITVISLFLLLSVMKLKFERGRFALLKIVSQYTLVALVTIGVGYMSSRPQMKSYYDATYTKANTLAVESQEVVEKLTGGLTITTYVNILDDNGPIGFPAAYKRDFERFEQYVRFKPEMKLKYVYYYDKINNPSMESRYPGLSDEERAKKLCEVHDLNFKDFLSPEEIRAMVDLKGEGNKFVRIIERENGQKTFLRLYNDNEKHPKEAEISAALKRFTCEAPLVAFIDGHGEREIDNYGERGYYLFAQDKGFRNSLPNQGFGICKLNLSKQDIPEDVTIVVISDLRDSLSAIEKAKLDAYVAKGGNMFIMGEYGRSETMNRITSNLGVSFSDGVLVNKNPYFSPTIAIGQFTEEGVRKFPLYTKQYIYNYKVSMPTALAIDYSKVKDFEVTPIVVTSGDSWIERETTDFVDSEFVLNDQAGEKAQSYPTLISMCRQVGDKEQRIIISGDADFISNNELTGRRQGITSANFIVIPNSFRWLSYDQFPISTKHPDSIDNGVLLPVSAREWLKMTFIWIFPLIVMVGGLIIILRRNKK